MHQAPSPPRTSAAIEQTTSRRSIVPAALLLVVLLANHQTILARQLSLDDDNAYLFLVGTAFSATPEQREWLEGLDARIAAMPFEGSRVAMYRARSGDRGRYPLSAFCYAAAQAAMRPAQPAAVREGYREFVARSLVAGFRLAFALAVALLLLALFVAADTAWWNAVLLGLSAVGALDLLAWPKTHLIGSVRFDWLVVLAAKSLWLLVDPTDPYSVFGFTGRSTFTLAFVGVLVLRARGRRAPGYALLLTAGLFHLRYLVLFGALLAAADLAWLVLRASGLVREPRSDLARVARDQGTMLLAVSGSVVAVRAVARLGDPFDTPLVWQDLTLRLLTVWQPSLVVAAAFAPLALVRRLAGSRHERAQRLVPAALAAALAVPALWCLPDLGRPRLNVLSGAASRERDLAQPLTWELSYADQAKLFYAQAKTIHLGEDVAEPLLPGARATGSARAP